MSFLKLNQVTLAMKDYEGSVRFYKKLGLVQIVASPPRYARFECPSSRGKEGAGDNQNEEIATLSLHSVDKDWVPSAWPLIYFEVEDLDNMLKKLAKQGIIPLAPAKTQTWLWREADSRQPSTSLSGRKSTPVSPLASCSLKIIFIKRVVCCLITGFWL